MAATLSSLVDALRQFKLLTPAQLQELETLPSASAAPEMLAQELMQRTWLTPYQANLLLQAKGEQLLLGSYVLLERLGETRPNAETHGSILRTLCRCEVDPQIGAERGHRDEVSPPQFGHRLRAGTAEHAERVVTTEQGGRVVEDVPVDEASFVNGAHIPIDGAQRKAIMDT